MKKTARVFAFTVLMMLALAWTPLRGQETQPAATQNPPQAAEPARPTNPNAAVSRELVEASKAAEGESTGEDQTTGLKHSVAVQWIAKKTGVTVETAYWIAMSFNFAIVILAIAALMKSQLPTYLRTRNEAIQRGLQEARAASTDAQRRLSDIEARLSRLDTEVAQIHAEADRESAAEEARIHAAAEAEVKRIMESSEQEIDAAGRQAQRDLKGLAANLAVELASGKLRVDQATDEALVRNFVAQLGKDGR